MKRFWLSIMAVLLITAAAVPAFAWEFSMNGEFEFRLRYFGRTGNADLYGDASVQENPAMALYDSASGFFSQAPGAALTAAGTVAGAAVINTYENGFLTNSVQNFVGFSGPNIYLTGFRGAANAAGAIISDQAATSNVRITRGGFSRYGSDALYNDMKLTLHPSFKVNNAIRVHGVYTIGGFRNKYAQTGYDANGQLSPGSPPFERYYSALSSMSAYNTAAIGSWEQMRATIQMPIGILSIGIKDFPFGIGTQFTQNARSDTFVFILPYGPFRIIYGAYLAEGSPAGGVVSYNSVPDKDTKNDIAQGLLIDYSQGPLNVGIGTLQFTHHLNAALSATAGPMALRGAAGQRAIDNYFSRWLVAMKYNNGRFFANSEYYWLNRDYHRIGTYPLYREGYSFFADAGVLAGPLKVDLVYAQASGTPLNANQVGGVGDNLTKWYETVNINYQAMRPYQFLMFETYGGGNNAFNADGTGQMSDAIALGGRIDYATAANLNLWGTFLYAKRLEKGGTYAGTYNTGLTAAAVPTVTGLASNSIANAQLWKAAVTGQAGLNPFVDDDLIGWEAQGGVSWKLLEGLTMDAAYSYWQPGAWFNQAYRAVTGSAAGLLGGDMWMTNRSAIQAIRGSFTIDF